MQARRRAYAFDDPDHSSHVRLWHEQLVESGLVGQYDAKQVSCDEGGEAQEAGDPGLWG